MNTPIPPIYEEHLKEVAQRFHYPPTPDVAGAVAKPLESGSRPRARLRSAWAVMGLLVVALAVLFAVPGVRAEIIRFFQVGVVRIFPSTPTRTAEPPPPQSLMTATPDIFTPKPGVNEPLYEIATSGLAGETTLEEAQARLPFPVRLPAFPPDLGPTDRVFLQENGQMVILVWTEPDDPDEVRFSLHEIGPEGVILSKYHPRVIQETQVNENYAVWVQGPYLVQLSNGVYEFRRMVEGSTLIWEEDGITYRLESDLTLEETIQIAESLR
jgi:hypothetical protein